MYKLCASKSCGVNSKDDSRAVQGGETARGYAAASLCVLALPRMTHDVFGESSRKNGGRIMGPYRQPRRPTGATTHIATVVGMAIEWGGSGEWRVEGVGGVEGSEERNGEHGGGHVGGPGAR